MEIKKYDIDTIELEPKKIQNFLKDNEFFKSINKTLKFLGEKFILKR